MKPEPQEDVELEEDISMSETIRDVDNGRSTREEAEALVAEELAKKQAGNSVEVAAELLAQLAGATGRDASHMYHEASPELKADCEVLLAVLAHTTGRCALEVLHEAPTELKADTEVILAALRAGGTHYALDVLRETPEKLRTDTEFVRAVLRPSVYCRYEEKKVLMLGLDHAGKTCILYQLKDGMPRSVDTVSTLRGMPVATTTTIGFNVETIEHKGSKPTIWDVGGLGSIRPLWRHYYQDTECLVFVVDSADEDRIGEARDDLHRVLSHDALQVTNLLVIANKQDLPNAMSVPDVIDKLELQALRSHKWHVQGACAISGEGLAAGFDWLLGSNVLPISCFELLGIEADKQFWLKALVLNADLFEHVPDELRDDLEIVAAAEHELCAMTAELFAWASDGAELLGRIGYARLLTELIGEDELGDEDWQELCSDVGADPSHGLSLAELCRLFKDKWGLNGVRKIAAFHENTAELFAWVSRGAEMITRSGAHRLFIDGDHDENEIIGADNSDQLTQFDDDWQEECEKVGVDPSTGIRLADFHKLCVEHPEEVQEWVDHLHKSQEKGLCRAQQLLAFVRGTCDGATSRATHIIANLDYDLLMMVCVAVRVPSYTLARATARTAAIMEGLPPC